MPEEEQRLRAAYALVMARAGEPHLDESAWERLACDELAPEARLRLLDHVVRCAACAEVYRALTHLAAEAPRERVVARRPLWRGTPLAALALAALVLAALVGPRRLVPPPAGVPDVLRSGAGSAGPHLLAPRGHSAPAPGQFTWQPLAQARAYRVLLTGADGTLLWSSAELKDTRLDWPAQVTPLPGRYYWQVLAVPAAGGAPLPSEMVAFELSATR